MHPSSCDTQLNSTSTGMVASKWRHDINTQLMFLYTIYFIPSIAITITSYWPESGSWKYLRIYIKNWL